MRTSQSIRVVVALAAAGLLAGAASPASAKKTPPPPPPPSCNLLVDAVGDVSPQYSGAVDILSADIASGQTTVVGVLRVKGPVNGTDPVTATGARWDLGFSVNGTQYTFELRRNALGASMATFSRGTAVVGIPAVRVDAGSITWTVPRATVVDLPATPNGDPLTKLDAATFSGIADLAADAALSKATYQDGYPSCVKAA